MSLAIVLNLASAAARVGGRSLGAAGLHKDLGSRPGPATRLCARRLPGTARCRGALLPGEYAA